MEIKFRPMSPSTLARQLKPGQSPTEDGQSFIEVVESLTATEQTPEKNPGGGGGAKQQQTPQNHSLGADLDETQNATEESPQPPPEHSQPPSPKKSDPEENPTGAHLDLTA